MKVFDDLRDPWVASGLLLLAVLSVGVLLVYRTAPQSVAEAGTRTWLAARPDAAAPHLALARQRLQDAMEAGAAGRDSAAAFGYAEAAEQAWVARELATDRAESSAATEVWARATLGWAAIVQETGTGEGLRRDNNELLRDALSLVERVLSVPTTPQIRARAQQMQRDIERQLLPRPLEWLPKIPLP